MIDATGTTRRRLLRRLLTLAAAGAAGLGHWSSALAQAVGDTLEKISGRIIRRGDDSYPGWWASMTWYLFKPKRYPDLIIQAKSEYDVIEAVNHARKNGLKVAVRSTGHNPAKSVLRDGGMLLDLSLLNSVEIDAATKTAWIQPGIRAADLLERTTAQGLAFPAAHTGIVGLGGYLLGGGLGWNMPEYGIACRSVLAAEIITADGEKLTASAEENPELLWAVRGVGPGFFGATVRYKLQLYPAHRNIRVRSYVIPVARLDEALAEFEKIGEASERQLEILIKIGRFHPSANAYSDRDLVITVAFFAFADSEDEAGRLLSPVAASKIAELSIASKEDIPLSYRDLYVPPETDHTSPGRTIVENMWTDEPAQALRLLAGKLTDEPPPSPRSFLLCGWSFNYTFEDGTSCVRTSGRHYMSWYMIADQEDHIDPNYQWMDEAVALMQPFAKGHYINEINPLRYPQRVPECFLPEDWERLGRLRKKYDPQGVFRGYLGPAEPGA